MELINNVNKTLKEDIVVQMKQGSWLAIVYQWDGEFDTFLSLLMMLKPTAFRLGKKTEPFQKEKVICFFMKQVLQVYSTKHDMIYSNSAVLPRLSCHSGCFSLQIYFFFPIPQKIFEKCINFPVPATHVGEFQDISVDRYKLLQALCSEKPKTKLYCVGDDWQSIFRFAGSDMALFYEFEKYFGYTEICRIETTYRFHQPLIDNSSAFVMKNHSQKKKTIKPPQGDTKGTQLYFIKCSSENDGVLHMVEKIVQRLLKEDSILIMGRYYYDAMSVGFKGKIAFSDNRIKVNIAGRDIFFLSVHSAKGLEADHVILVNCNQGACGLPSLIEDAPILDFVLSRSEQYPFAEERRLFYVAMTRAKKRMIVLYDQMKPSPFISEFLLKIEVGSYLCPKCLEGKIVPVKDGFSSNGTKYLSFTCTSNEASCDFFETRYGDITPPGTLIIEDMTTQDVERMRENRRRARQGGFGLPQYSQQSQQTGGGRRFIPSNRTQR